jgi:hypothetical protein
MTIYRLYSDNGDSAGFWVQHRKWANVCARVKAVAGLRRGKLPGAAPLHDRAPAEFQWFDVRSGRPLEAPPVTLEPEDKNYASIAVPWWSRRSEPSRGAHAPVSAGGSKAF